MMVIIIRPATVAISSEDISDNPESIHAIPVQENIVKKATRFFRVKN
jgi:hypothetical protein